MTSRRPLSVKLAALAALAVVGQAPAAVAIPLLDVGASASAGAHFVAGGPALDLAAEANLRGWLLGGQYWNQLGGGRTYMQATIRKDVSPIPMIAVAPGIGLAAANGSFGPLAQLSASFSPFLLPVSLEAGAGAAYVQNQVLLPYHAGAKLSVIPFTSLVARYRGWAGGGSQAGLSGPEIGIEIGL